MEARILYSKLPLVVKEEEKLQAKEASHDDANIESLTLNQNDEALSEEASEALEAIDEDSEEYLTEEEEALIMPVFIEKEARSTGQVVKTEHPAALAEREREEARQYLVDVLAREYTAAAQASEELASRSALLAVDDDDEANAEEDLENWKLRELLRFKRDREEREKWEREKIEMEQLRNLTEEERKQIDLQKQKEWEAQPKGSMKFLQKYYHKGAFFSDSSDPIFQRDYQQATGEDTAMNREILPQVLQVRNFGKKGRTKWTHLVAEDTTAFDYGWGQRSNDANYTLINQMGGMRGTLDPPSSKRTKRE